MQPKVWTMIACAAAFAADGAGEPATGPVTFYKDVLPILQKNCQSCHRLDQIEPMSFLTYKSVRPWAKAMKGAVLSRKMPPWFADPGYSHYKNDRTLPQTDIEIIAKWADSGAAEGDAKDAPPPVQWPEKGWLIKPDVVVDMPEFKVPAQGMLEWTDITIPSPFKEDTWITSMEILPDHPGAIHHMGVL